MGKGYRTGRLGEEIRRIISDMLLKGVKDPRLAGRMISITGVEVTSDGSYATCYITVFAAAGSDAEPNKEVLEGLHSASGMFRSEIGKQLKIRHAPELIFKIDSSMEYGRHIDEVLSTLDIRPEEPEQEEQEDEQ
ncbi:MAG: 30S ribosome-binding factor RbfA [Firmicutes bacterium]|nr:30S ribosome-binding factor RbfA [Bacillota bacterium]